MLSEPRADGMTLATTAAGPRQSAITRGPGFIGVMANGET
jgi:hypothetical protein